MIRSSHALKWCLPLLAAMVAAPAARADAVSAVQVLRAGGCGGVMPLARPLRRNALLDRAARVWADGGALAQAARRNGYAAGSAQGVHVSGADSALLELLRRSECRQVTSRALSEVGVYRRGPDSWLVLAGYASYAAPPGLQRPGVSPPLATYRPPVATYHAPPASVPAPAAAAAGSRLATRALELVNDVRARGTRCGAKPFAPAPPVSLSGTLDGVALGHAVDMAEHDYFEHVDPAGRTPADRVRAVGYREKLVGENIAYGPKTVDEVVQGWLGSPGHCENIMDPRFTEMGIADAAGEASKRALYWVQVLASPRS